MINSQMLIYHPPTDFFPQANFWESNHIYKYKYVQTVCSKLTKPPKFSHVNQNGIPD